jgi:nickel-dependent lactate racemase
MKSKIGAEVQKVISQVKSAQKQFETAIKEGAWIAEAKKFAEKRGVQVQKTFSTDLKKVKAFVQKEKKELQKIQKQVPAEVKKLKKFVAIQQKELQKLLRELSKKGKTGSSSGAAPKAKRGPRKASKRPAAMAPETTVSSETVQS